MYPTDVQQKLAAGQSTNAHPQGAIGINDRHLGAQAVAGSETPPVEYAARRLFDRLGQLQAETDVLTERLAAVTRPESPDGEGANRARERGECDLVEVLNQAADRVEHVINRLSSARSRLCI